MWILNEIRRTRREGLGKSERFRLEKEDMEEENEFRQYQAEVLASELGGELGGLGGLRPTMPVREEEKRPRQSGMYNLFVDMLN